MLMIRQERINQNWTQNGLPRLVQPPAEKAKRKRRCMKNARLQTAREREGFTQKQIAEIVGITESAYQKYELGKRIPNAIIISRIAKNLNTTVEALYGEE